MRPATRFAKKRSRLLVAFLCGALVVAILPASLGLTHRLLVGWNVAAWGYLVLLGWLMGTAKAAKVEKIAAQFYADVAPKINVREAQRVLERYAKQHQEASGS